MSGSPEHFQDQDANSQIGIATGTFYREWYPGEVRGELTNDKVRGDLAVETLQCASEMGYQTVVVDGGSSETFTDAISNFEGVEVQSEQERGMSAGRRQALGAVANKQGVEIVAWTEPEKISMVRDCMTAPVDAVLNGEADLVIPRRNHEGFATYPEFQAKYEQESVVHWNNILRRHGLLSENDPDLDSWIGPRVFRNEQGILDLFTRRYKFDGKISGLEPMQPELWSNALFIPVVAALEEGYNVKGIDVPYRHPEIQTIFESEHANFPEKRALQQRSILTTTAHYLRMKEGGRSRLQSF